MLVLTRERNETIMIGDDVEITIVDVHGGKVRLGITAPAHVAVHRKEVYEAIKREKEANGQLKSGDPPAVESLAGRREKVLSLPEVAPPSSAVPSGS